VTDKIPAITENIQKLLLVIILRLRNMTEKPRPSQRGWYKTPLPFPSVPVSMRLICCGAPRKFTSDQKPNRG